MEPKFQNLCCTHPPERQLFRIHPLPCRLACNLTVREIISMQILHRNLIILSLHKLWNLLTCLLVTPVNKKKENLTFYWLLFLPDSFSPSEDYWKLFYSINQLTPKQASADNWKVSGKQWLSSSLLAALVSKRMLSGPSWAELFFFLSNYRAGDVWFSFECQGFVQGSARELRAGQGWTSRPARLVESANTAVCITHTWNSPCTLYFESGNTP